MNIEKSTTEVLKEYHKIVKSLKKDTTLSTMDPGVLGGIALELLTHSIGLGYEYENEEPSED
jgi:hypothetical protein